MTGVAGLATYAMTKGAMNALTRSVAVDFGSQLIRSNAIIVGNVPVSEIVQFLANHPVAGPELLGVNSIPRLGVGDDIAAAAAFLVSDASAWITGSLWPSMAGTNRGRRSATSAQRWPTTLAPGLPKRRGRPGPFAEKTPSP